MSTFLRLTAISLPLDVTLSISAFLPAAGVTDALCAVAGAPKRRTTWWLPLSAPPPLRHSMPAAPVNATGYRNCRPYAPCVRRPLRRRVRR